MADHACDKRLIIEAIQNEVGGLCERGREMEERLTQMETALMGIDGIGGFIPETKDTMEIVRAATVTTSDIVREVQRDFRAHQEADKSAKEEIARIAKAVAPPKRQLVKVIQAVATLVGVVVPVVVAFLLMKQQIAVALINAGIKAVAP